jgi:hypothetical protein
MSDACPQGIQLGFKFSVRIAAVYSIELRQMVIARTVFALENDH